MNQLENKDFELPSEIEVYLYDKNIINGVLDMLNKLKIEGMEQAALLSEIGKFIKSPVKKDILKLKEGEEE